MTPDQMHSRIAEVVDSLYDIEKASEVVLCLSKALEMVIVIAAANKKDALETATDVMKDMRRDIDKGYASTWAAWEKKFPEARRGHCNDASAAQVRYRPCRLHAADGDVDRTSFAQGVGHAGGGCDTHCGAFRRLPVEQQLILRPARKFKFSPRQHRIQAKT